ncbi:hypothetical protein MNB_SUP05-SYMBIONT-5-1431 [hydrothermal vent metagenome]|uniref:Uncharacterized protein n=1 Tax=hydrothermal vent metagenome TaxID=652676 RepID=A0A1W1E5Z8_9ZZZZ
MKIKVNFVDLLFFPLLRPLHKIGMIRKIQSLPLKGELKRMISTFGLGSQ